ncbi:MAG: hypothetical protein U0271_05335 [Polyangiaceae bacterium]
MLEAGDAFGPEHRVLRRLRPEDDRVYVVVDDAGVPSVLKLVPNAVDHDALRRLSALRTVSSEHVARVLDAGVDDQRGPFVMLELVEGETLGELFARRGVLTTTELADLLGELADALACAQHLDVEHGYLDPACVLRAASASIDGNTGWKVAGFDRLLVDPSIVPSANRLLWMAPEWARVMSPAARRNVARRADVWSIALLAFRALFGAPYFRVAAPLQPTEILRRVFMDPLVSASERAAELGVDPPPRGFDAWFRICLDREPTARYLNAGYAIGELQRLFTEVTAPAPRAPEVGRFTSGDRTEDALLDELRGAPDDPELRAVYADLLEQRREPGKLAVLRGDALGGDEAGPRWRSIVANPRVGSCLKFALKCPKRWGDLTPTDRDGVRHCADCDKPVYFCSTVFEARARGANRQCVAIDFGAPAARVLDEYQRGAREQSAAERLFTLRELEDTVTLGVVDPDYVG